jgi:predicted MPP superfamily phosphohydrolase
MENKYSEIKKEFSQEFEMLLTKSSLCVEGNLTILHLLGAYTDKLFNEKTEELIKDIESKLPVARDSEGLNQESILMSIGFNDCLNFVKDIFNHLLDK